MIIVNGWKPLSIITKRSILDVAAAPDSPLILINNLSNLSRNLKFSQRFDILEVFMPENYSKNYILEVFMSENYSKNYH